MSVDVNHTLAGPEDAPVLVFSNSLGTTGAMWDAQAASLSERFRVLRYDTRGHGGTPAPPGPYSVADLAGDVLALLDRLGLERVSFCGLSIGGMTGMWLGVHAPERIERLAICCTGMQLPTSEMWTERAAQVRREGMGSVIDATIERWFTPGFRERNPEVVGRIREIFLTTDPEGYAGCCEALAEFDMRGQLDVITAATLVIAGEDDPVGTPERTAAIAEEIEGSRLVVLPEARHLAAVEQADAVTRELEQLLGVGAAT
ncbi:MAG TPA: 3-oxoadipate enol-lactonase [Solirubrobacterales bacterium]|nr:3-oxoadipate enol-lactonase [Solirubrobacterales bacterium]